MPCCYLKRVAHVVGAVDSLSGYRSDSLPYVQCHITIKNISNVLSVLIICLNANLASNYALSYVTLSPLRKTSMPLTIDLSNLITVELLPINCW